MECRQCLLYGVIALLFTASVGYGIYYYTGIQPENEIFISTTTSVQNTGLLDYLIKDFEASHSFTVKYTAVGSGAAIQLARDGEVDAVLVHAPALEQDLIDDNYAEKRNTLWYNYFIIVGPSDDPAGVQSANSAVEAFELIYEKGQNGEVTFYSRGDQSGTHLKEQSIWQQSQYDVDAQADWYFETGTGMSSTLATTDNDPDGYTLTDIGTYATIQGSQTPISKIKLFEQDELLYNPYSYLVIDSATTGTNLNTEGANVFLEYLQQPSTDDLVRNYTVGDIVLFTPVGDD